MKEIEDARALIFSSRFKEAGAALDKLLVRDKGNAELWYLRGLVSTRMKSYDAAQECFDRAIALDKKADYVKAKGMANLELLEIEEALMHFEYALSLNPKDPTIHFFIAVCYMVMNDPRSREHISLAYILDRKKTKLLLKNLFSSLLAGNPSMTKKYQQDLLSKLESV